MIDYDKLVEFLNEQIEHHDRRLNSLAEINQHGNNKNSLSHYSYRDAYQHVLYFINGESDD